MSTTIDQRVVEMRFDNKQFESNASTTMSTLDKLKQRLNFSGATKGLEDINTATKNVNMSGLGAAVETVSAKFSALQVMGVTALANLTNSALNAGKRIAKSLTLDPITDGFSEYEMTLNAVQTTMSATGKTAEEVEKQLKTLDEYADKTIYSTADMLNNLPKFTNAGVELEVATKAMIGISNATALAGGDAGKASIAFYNLGQAIGTGYLSRMDYNSINSAGIATMEWKNQMVEAAIAQGTLTKVGEDAYQAGNKTLTLQQLFIDGLQEQWATTDVMLKVFGDYGDETTEIGKKAYGAAQDVKTFSMMMDSLKATAGTGWKDTWQIIFGGLDEAKEFWTGLNNVIGGFISKMADARNNLLTGVLDFGSPWAGIAEKIEGAGLGKIKKVAESVGEVTDKLTHFQDIVNKVWRGDYKTSDTGRYEMLEAAGYDHRVVQDLVNKGYDYKLTIEDIEASHKKFGLTMEKTTESTEKTAGAFVRLSEEKLKEAGLTEEEIKLYNDLADEAERTGVSISDLADKMSKTDGRTLLIDSLKNAGDGLVGIFKALGQAWSEIFPAPSIVRIYNIIEAINKFSENLRLTDKETGKLNENGQKIQRTFKGIFAALDIVLTLVGGPLKIALKLLSQLLGAFGFNILDVTAWLGDGLVALRDWMDSVLDFSAAFEKIAEPIKNAWAAFKAWIDSLKDSENLPADIAKGIASGFGKAFDFIVEMLKKLGDSLINGFNGMPGDMISGFANGLWNGIKIAGQVMIELGKIILEKIKGVLGIHSPSTEFMEIAKNCIDGLANGIKEYAPKAWEVIKGLGAKLVEIISNIDIGTVIGAVAALGISKGIKEITGAFTSILKPVANLTGGLAEILTNAGEAITTVANAFAAERKGLAFEHIGEGIKSIAIAIAILVASVIALTFVDQSKLLGAIGTILALATIIGVLSFVVSKMQSAKLGDILKISVLMSAFAGAMIIMAGAMGIVALIPSDKAGQAIGGLLAMAVAMVAVLAVFGAISNNKSKKSMSGVASTLLVMAVAIGIMAVVAKLMSGMDPGELKQGLLAVGVFAGIIAGLLAATRLLGHKGLKYVATTLLAMAAAIGVMGLVVRLLAGMSTQELIQGGVAVAVFAGIIVGLMAATKLLSKNDATGMAAIFASIAAVIGVMGVVVKLVGGMPIPDLIKGGLAVAAFAGIIVGLMAATKLLTPSEMKGVSAVLLTAAIAIGAMGLVVRLVGGMSLANIAKGVLAVAAFAGIIVGLMAATKLVGNGKLASMGVTLLLMSVAIGIMGGVAALLSFISLPDLAKGIVAVGIIAGMMALMIVATKNAKKCTGNLIAMTAAIAVIALAVAALSRIEFAKLAGATAAMAILMGVFTLLVKIAGTAQKSMGTLIVLTIAVGLLAGVLYLLSGIDSKSLISSALSLSALLLAMSGALAILSFVGKDAKSALFGVLALLAMAVPLMAFVGVLAVMQFVGHATRSVLALVALATACTALLIPLSLVGVIIGASGGMALLGVVGLLAMAVPLIAFVGVLAVMQFVGKATENTILLIALATACTALLVPLTVVGLLAAGAVMGLAALLAMSIVLLAFVGVLAVMQCVNDATVNTTLLISLMTAMTGVLTALAIIGPLALIGVVAMAGLLAVMVAMGAFAIAVGALLTEFPQLETFLDRGLPVLEKLAHGIGLIVGKFVGGLAEGMLESLPQIGTYLSEFIANAEPFIAGVKMVDDQVLKGVGVLTAAVIALTAADLIAGIAAFLQGGSSFATLGTELSQFMTNAMPFVEGSKQLDTNILDGIKTLAEAVLILTAADILEGLTSWFTGGSSLTSFGEQLPVLGSYLNQFITNIGTFGEDQLKTATTAANALKTIAAAAATIPNEGGILAAIVGDNGLGAFAPYLPELGKHLNGFITNIGTFGEDQLKTVNTAAEALKLITEAASSIPNEGGILAAIVGDNGLGAFAPYLSELGRHLNGFITNLGTFGEEQLQTVKVASEALKVITGAAATIPNEGGVLAAIVGDNGLGTFAPYLSDLGTHLNSFITNLGVFGPDQLSTVTTAANALESIANVAAHLPNEGGILAAIVGDNALGTFSAYLPTLGTHLNNFIVNIGTFGADQLATVNAVVKALNAMAALSKTDLKSTAKNLDDFGKEMVDFGDDLVDFVENANGTEGKSVSSAVDNLKTVVDAAKTIATVDSDAIKNFGDALKKLGDSGVSKFVEAFTSSENISKVKTAAEDMVKSAIEGVEGKTEDLETSFTNIISSAAGAIGTVEQYNKFVSAGKYLVEGFAAGISANTYKATAKAKAMADAAAKAAKKALDEHSPSKVFYKIGDFAGLGFVNALDDYGDIAYSSGSNMADLARKGLSNAIGKIQSLIDSDMDVQPTIRPVVDLSDVKTGVGAISSMFNGGASVGVLANVGSVSSIMNRRNQNGGNSDVVSAIDKLRKEMGDMDRSTYNINGVTYDDGSAISEAVETIIRAARVERRV